MVTAHRWQLCHPSCTPRGGSAPPAAPATSMRLPTSVDHAKIDLISDRASLVPQLESRPSCEWQNPGLSMLTTTREWAGIRATNSGSEEPPVAWKLGSAAAVRYQSSPRCPEWRRCCYSASREVMSRRAPHWSRS